MLIAHGTTHMAARCGYSANRKYNFSISKNKFINISFLENLKPAEESNSRQIFDDIKVFNVHSRRAATLAQD